MIRQFARVLSFALLLAAVGCDDAGSDTCVWESCDGEPSTAPTAAGADNPHPSDKVVLSGVAVGSRYGFRPDDRYTRHAPYELLSR